MAKVKTTDPYGPTFFEEGRPLLGTVSDPTSAEPNSAIGDAAEPIVPAPDETLARGGEEHTTGVAHKEASQGTVRLNADIDRDLHRLLRLRVASEGITIADFLREILRRELMG